MEDPNITMGEYIRVEEEKARRHDKVYNWETATYGKIWYDEDIHDLRSVESEFPSIVFTDTLTSEIMLSCKPTVSPFNDNEIDSRISFDESDDKDYTPWGILPLPNEINTDVDMALPPRDQRHQYLRFEGLEYTDADITNLEERLRKIYDKGKHWMLVLYFENLPTVMAEGLTSRMLMKHRDT
uniref:Uncharacterized protein n=1 Tax=Tanacetum cinerariifolium TaxID=118510 RepID=A0A6L2K5A3_TANCI|nr:hypothetical protein [Tanacetum cinerariifolium]